VAEVQSKSKVIDSEELKQLFEKINAILVANKILDKD
jgi:hypothetical protein